MVFYCFQDRDILIKELTKRLNDDDDDDEFTSMHFLRQLVYNRPNFTRNFIRFDDVDSSLESENANECNIEDTEMDELEQTENASASMPSITRCASSQSVCSSVASSSSTASSYSILCSQCGIRKKDSLIQCGHAICGVCFINMKEAREQECIGYKVAQRRKEEKKMKCPLCSKQINDKAQQILDD